MPTHVTEHAAACQGMYHTPAHAVMHVHTSTRQHMCVTVMPTHVTEHAAACQGTYHVPAHAVTQTHTSTCQHMCVRCPHM